MWSGDMQSGYPTQWALNPSAYQNLSNDQVDWASLAQQWIKLKETFPEEQIPPAPPPPPIKLGELPDVEGGEAPMDVSKDENPSDNTSWNSWDNWQQWNWNWNGPGTAPSTSAVPPVTGSKVAAVPPYYTQSNSVPNIPTNSSNSFDYNHGTSLPEQFNQQNYWSEPARFIRGKQTEWRDDKSNVRPKSVKSEEEEDSTATIDSAKRKQLPAWIREGLEKMEREKQKKIERERMLKQREEEIIRYRMEEEQAAQQNTSGIPPKSKFDSDSEESEKDSEEVVIKQKRSRFYGSGSSSYNQESLPSSPPAPPQPQRSKTKAQIHQEVMPKVRKILTEILMSVTNDEIRLIVDETLASYRAKAPAIELRKTPALTSLTGKLGLGIYDSESEASEQESDNEVSTQENGVDSDQELRERVARRKQEFALIEKDIENQIRELEEKEAKSMLEEETQEEEKEQLEQKDVTQVEPNHNVSGSKLELQEEEGAYDQTESNIGRDGIYDQTPERSHKSEKESSIDQSSKSSSRNSSESSHYSYSRSRSSSDSRHKTSRKSRRRKEKTSNRSRRKRSLSRGSDRRKLSHRDASSERRHDKRSKYRSRSRDGRRYNEYSDSSSRQRHSRSRHRSPEYSDSSSRRRRSRSRHRSPEYSDSSSRRRRSHSRHRSPSYHRSSSHQHTPSGHHFSIVSYSASRKRRQHHSHSSSPEVSRGKRSSYRSRD